MASPAVILTPMFHLTGMLPVLRAPSLGGAIHIIRKWNADAAFDMIERSGLTRLAFVPTMLWDMLNSPRATPQNLAAIRSLAYGGGPLNTALVEEVRRRMPKSLITNTYGQSENAGWACSLSGRPYLDNPQSCGWACPTLQVCVRREDGTAADIGEPGELWVRGANLMTEYVGDPAATAETLKDGWCATGDIGKVDEAGLFTILDRKKDMIISGGENIYCAEVENVLASHPQIVEVAVIGRAHEKWGEVPIAVAAVAGDPLRLEDLGEFLAERLARYKHPKALEIVDALPRNPAGKVLKTELRVRYEATIVIESATAAKDSTIREEG